MLVMAASSQSAPEPYSVKADKLGEALTEWKANNPQVDKCNNNTVDNRPDSAVDPDVIYCFPRSLQDGQSLTYATAPLLTETAWFYNGRLYKVEMTLFSSAWLTNVMTGLAEKFGAPAGRETTPLQNGFGARFEQERWTWTNGVSTVELMYSNAPSNCPDVTFTLDSPNKDVTDRQKQAERLKARSDM